jgi:DNA transposition AAA+ family ATPase
MGGIYDEGLHQKLFELAGTAEEGKKHLLSKAAKMIGYSTGTLTQYRNRTYSGDISTLEKKVAEWILRVERRLERLDVPIQETENMDKIMRAITVAHDEADIAIVVGDAGSGKTTALRQYAQKTYSSILIEVDPGFTQLTLMRTLARALNINTKGSQSTLVENIIEALDGRDTVIMVDEADYLTDNSLELLRRVINDKSHSGVVLSGLPRLEYKIKNLRNDHQQLQSRIGVIARCGPMKKADAKAIIGGVWKELPKQVIDSMMETAKGPARTLVKLMGRVHQTMFANGQKRPDVDTVSEAAELLMGD